MLLTNLHLQRSTLSMLIAGLEWIKAAYAHTLPATASSSTATSASSNGSEFGRDHYSIMQSAPNAAHPGKRTMRKYIRAATCGPFLGSAG